MAKAVIIRDKVIIMAMAPIIQDRVITMGMVVTIQDMAITMDTALTFQGMVITMGMADTTLATENLRTRILNINCGSPFGEFFYGLLVDWKGISNFCRIPS